ncbi:MAG: hypothetical protein JNK85_18120 [Verrucomicrobiales bacterium]|nr:hypothetical protein [Verrucomicrobiales bacterium]
MRRVFSAALMLGIALFGHGVARAVDWTDGASFEHPAFDSQRAFMRLGKDGNVYLVTWIQFEPCYVLRIAHDGSVRSGALIGSSTEAAIANADGVMFSLQRAWNQQGMTLSRSNFTTLLTRSLSYPWAALEAGDSGDFYIMLGNTIERYSPSGALVQRYSHKVPSGVNHRFDLRVCEKRGLFYIPGSDKHIHVVDVTGQTLARVPADLQAPSTTWSGGLGDFDVDGDGHLYILTNPSHEVRRVELLIDETTAAVRTVETRIALDVPAAQRGATWTLCLRVRGTELLVRRMNTPYLFFRFDRQTGAFLGGVSPRTASLKVTVPDSVWTAGQAIAFKVALDSPSVTLAPKWRVWGRPLGSMEYREFVVTNGMLQVPADISGAWQMKVSAEPDPRLQTVAPALAAQGTVLIRAPESRGTANVYTPASRTRYGQGETIPFDVEVRAVTSGDAVAPVSVSLTDGVREWLRWEVPGTPGITTRLEVPSVLTRALRPGTYTLTATGPGLTPAPQWLQLGPGIQPRARRSVLYADFGNTYASEASSFANLADTVDLQLRWLNRMGFDWVYDRWGSSDYPSQVAVPDWMAETTKVLSDRFGGADGLSPSKLAVAPFHDQLVAGEGANGIVRMLGLLTMDAGLPLGTGFDKRTPEEMELALRELTERFGKYPAFRGWSWGSLWWLYTMRGANGGIDAQEKQAYADALQKARDTGEWSPVLETVSNRRFQLARDTWQRFNDSLDRLAPGAITASAPPFRNVECHPTESLANVQEIDLQQQFEQVSVPYHALMAVDYYARPGRHSWSHPELGNGMGTGDDALPNLFLALARGATGVGAQNRLPAFGNQVVEPRENRAGTLTGYRRFNDFLRAYGSWLATLSKRDRVAIPVSSRQARVDEWQRHFGGHFARLFEASMTCYHAHDPATFVFSEELGERGFRDYGAVMLVDQWLEPEPALQAALSDARAGGIPILYDGSCRKRLTLDYQPLGIAFTNLGSDLGQQGDDHAYRRFPIYVRRNLAAVRDALRLTGSPEVEADSDDVFVTTLGGEQGRYTFVANYSTIPLDPALMYRVSLYAAHRLPIHAKVRFAKPAAAIYDVFAQRRVEPVDGAVDAELSITPVRLFASLPAPIDRVQLVGPDRIQAGDELRWSVRVLDPGGATVPASIPIRVLLLDAEGQRIAEGYVAAGSDGATGTFMIPVNLAPGGLRLEAVEMIAGKGAVLGVAVDERSLPLGLTDLGQSREGQANGVATPELMAPYEQGFGPRVRDVALANDGRLAILTSFNWDQNLYGLDVETGEVKFRRRVGHYFAFSPKVFDGGFTAQGFDLHSAEGYQVYRFGWDGEPTRRFSGYGLPQRLPQRFLPTSWIWDANDAHAVAPDGSWIAVAGDLGMAVWTAEGELRWREEWPKERRRVRLAGVDAERLLVLEGPTVVFRSAANGAELSRENLGITGEILMARFDQSRRVGALFGTADGGQIHILKEGRRTATFPARANNARVSVEMDISADGTLVVAAIQGALQCYSVDGGMLWSFSGDEQLRSPRIAAEDHRIAVSSSLGTLYVFSADGHVLLERDQGGLVVPTWLPGGDLLLASWMGPVSRLGTDYRIRWRNGLQPEPTNLRATLLAKDSTPTSRIEDWSTAEPESAGLLPQLANSVAFKVTVITDVSGDGGARLNQRVSWLFDGLTNASPLAWIDWTAINAAAANLNANQLVLDAQGRRFEIGGLTLYEDPDRPESWMRDVIVEAWDSTTESWTRVMNLLATAPVHTHRFPSTVRTEKLRLLLKAGCNPRLGELVLHGTERLTSSAPVILVPPSSLAVEDGVTGRFQVTAGGAGPFTYQWYKDGVALTDDDRIEGARTDSLRILGVRRSDAAGYHAMVSGPFGAPASSRVATLSVRGAEPLLQGVKLGVGGVLEVRLGGRPGMAYRMERSENLREWELLRRVVDVTPPLTLELPSPTGSVPWFYRAVPE